MDDESKRNIGRNIPDGSKNQEGKSGGYFQANGLEHFSFSPKTIISWGVLSGLVGIIVASITVYQSFGSNVDERITNHRELNKTLIDHDNRIKKTEENQTEMKTDIKNIICYIAKGKDPRCK